jgi:predicted RND superfamily exporter protein
MTAFLSRLTKTIVSHRYLVILSTTLVSIAMAVGLLEVRVDIDPDQQLPQDHPYIRTLNRLNTLFGDKNLVIVGLVPVDGDPFRPTFLKTLRRITQRIQELPGVDSRLLQSLGADSTTLIERSAEQFTVQPALPVTLDERTAAETRQKIMADPLLTGVLVSHDGSAFAIYCTIELTDTLPGYVDIHRAIKESLDAEHDGSFEYLLSGPVIVASELNLQAGQVGRYFAAAVGTIALVLYLTFRTWQAIVLPVLTGLLAVVWSLGLMGHLSLPLDPFNATTPILILAVGTGHAAQLLKRYYEELADYSDNDLAIVRTVGSVGGATVASGTIAILSFLSLTTLGTQSMRTFGLLTAFGIMSILVIELTFIPALRSLMGAPERPRTTNTNTSTGNFLDILATRISQPRIAQRVLATYGVLIAGSAILAQRLVVDTSFKRNLAPDDIVRRDDDQLNLMFSGTNDLIMLLSTTDDRALITPESVAAIAQLQDRLASIPEVGRSLSFVDTLKSIHSSLRDPDNGEAVPSSEEVSAQYLFLYSLSGGAGLGTILTPDYKIAKLTVLLHNDSTQYAQAVISQALAIATQELPETVHIEVTGTLASNAALTEVMVRGKLRNMAQIVGVTAAIASALFQSLALGLLVVVPVVVSGIFNFGLMALLGIPLDIVTAVVIALSVGIGADYSIYLLARFREESLRGMSELACLERTLATSGSAVISVASAIGLGFVVLCASGFRLFVQLGGLVALSMLTVTVSTLLLIPAILTIVPSLRSQLTSTR